MFPVNFAKFLRTPFLRNTPKWLLLEKRYGNLIWLNILVKYQCWIKFNLHAINGTERRKFCLTKTVANVDAVTQGIHFFVFINPFLAIVPILYPQKILENPVPECLFFVKLQACNFIKKETLAQGFLVFSGGMK